MSTIQHNPQELERSSPPVSLRDMIGGLRVTQLIYVAAKLGIADMLNDGPKHIDTLASMANVNLQALYRVLRALASMGIFAETGERHFALTPLAEPLRDGVPGSVRAWAIMLGDEGFWKPWGDLLHGVKTGETPFTHVFGMDRWEYLAKQTDAGKIFNQMMAAATARAAEAVVEAYDFSGVTSVVDIGGGRGILMIAILKKYFQVRGILTELPAVAAEAQAFIASEGLGERCEALPGNFFEAVPSGADIYILKSIIQSVDDDETVTILKNCHQAMGKQAKLLIVDAIMPPHGSPSPTNLTDVQMMVITGGQQRTEVEHKTLMEKAGFHLHRIVPTKSDASIIEGVPI